MAAAECVNVHSGGNCHFTRFSIEPHGTKVSYIIVKKAAFIADGDSAERVSLGAC